MRVVAVSGGFDPVHIGHLRMLIEAKALGDKLVVIANNDNWLKLKKSHSFMPEAERKEILVAAVDELRIEFIVADQNDLPCRSEGSHNET